MKNSKGFSLVELLAVVAILGILTGIAILSYSRYVQKAREKAYETIQKSTINATEEYLMDHPGATEVTIEELIEGEYLEKTTDPLDKSKTCRGKVSVIQNQTEGTLDTNNYLINICCTNYNHTYKSETKEDSEDKRCKADPYNFDDIPKIKVLNVYANKNYKNYVKNWMNTYGKNPKTNEQIIFVTPVSIDDFNANPDNYLDDENKYDEIVFGFSDCYRNENNAQKDLNAASALAVRQYIENGGAVIFGHDTITHGCGNHTNFISLQDTVGIKTGGSLTYDPKNKVVIAKEGVFTEYPYEIGEESTKLTIPSSHVYGQIADGATVWITFDGITDPNKSIYLSTYGNNAFIQTGHSNGQATDDEQKIIANIIFYMVAKQYVND